MIHKGGGDIVNRLTIPTATAGTVIDAGADTSANDDGDSSGCFIELIN